MKKKQFIQSMSNGDAVECCFLVTKAEKKISKANTPYWDVLLQDATGAMPAKIWHPVSANIIDLSKESFVFITGIVETYNNALQLKIERLETFTERALQDIEVTEFVRSSIYPIEGMWNELIALCTDVFTYKPWYSFTINFFSDEQIMEKLKRAVAAKSMHHAYRAGLLEHMLSVAKLCKELSNHYPQIDAQMLVAGALFHDIGKLVELEGLLTTEYTTEGKLLGHITQGIELITPFMQEAQLDEALQIHLKHIILSHHGYLEYGSPKLPQTAEAFLVHYADNIDAKMEMFRSIFANVNESEEAWAKLYGLGDIFHPIHTSVFETMIQEDDEKNTSIQQLSLL